MKFTRVLKPLLISLSAAMKPGWATWGSNIFKGIVTTRKNGHWLVLLLFQRQRRKIYGPGNWEDLNSHCIKPIGQNSLTLASTEGIRTQPKNVSLVYWHLKLFFTFFWTYSSPIRQPLNEQLRFQLIHQIKNLDDMF